MERTTKDEKYIALGLNKMLEDSIYVANSAMCCDYSDYVKDCIKKVWDVKTEIAGYQAQGVNFPNEFYIASISMVKKFENKITEWRTQNE